jgi:hypothetical protein
MRENRTYGLMRGREGEFESFISCFLFLLYRSQNSDPSAANARQSSPIEFLLCQLQQLTASYLLPPISCLLSPISCLLSPTSYFLHPISCFLFPASSLFFPPPFSVIHPTETGIQSPLNWCGRGLPILLSHQTKTKHLHNF